MNYIWQLIPINNFKYLNNICDKITNPLCENIEYCHTIFCNKEYVWNNKKYLGGPPLFIITNSDSFRPYQLFLSNNNSSPFFEQNYNLQNFVELSNDLELIDLRNDYILDTLPKEHVEYTCEGCTDYSTNTHIGAGVEYIRYKSKALKNIDALSSEPLPEKDFGTTLVNLDLDAPAWYSFKPSKSGKYYFSIILSPGKKYGRISAYNSNVEKIIEKDQNQGIDHDVFENLLGDYLTYIGQSLTQRLNEFDKPFTTISFDAIRGQTYYIRAKDIAGFSWGFFDSPSLQNNFFFRNKIYNINNIIYLPKTTDQNLPITYTSSNPEVLMISGGNQGMILKNGQVILTASNPGNNLLNPISKSINLNITYKV
jgi:hypothetical protein